MQNKYLLFIPVGALAWFVFLIGMRLIGDAVFSIGNPLLALSYLLAFPIMLVTNIGIGLVLRIPLHELTIPTVIATTTALMLDGLAVGFTDFYGHTDDQARASGAFLLWAAGVTVVISLWLAERGPKTAQ